MREFGKVRNIGNRQPDFGYAMATGDSTDLPDTQAELLALLDALLQKIKDLQAQKVSITASLNSWRIDYEKKVADNCEKIWSKDKRQGCIADREMKLGKVQERELMLKNIDSQIAGINDKINEVKKTLETYRGVSTSLAQSGKTEEQIRIEAQAKADALVRESQTKSDIEQRSSKSRRNIVILIVLAVVVIGGFVIYKKYFKKNG